MSRDADNLGTLHQIIEAKSGGVLDPPKIVQNFNLGPVGSDRPNGEDCTKHIGRLKLDDITDFHRRVPLRRLGGGAMSGESLTHAMASGTHASIIIKAENWKKKLTSGHIFASACQGIVKDDGHSYGDRCRIKDGARSGSREHSQ